jgi:hypothetical protein
VDNWNASPHKVDTIMLLGSGEEREGDTVWWLGQQSEGNVRAVRIDTCIGGYGHDWTVTEVHARLIEWTECPFVVALNFAWDCGPWTPLRCIQPGPKPLFDSDHLNGIPLDSGDLPTGVTVATAYGSNGLL